MWGIVKLCSYALHLKALIYSICSLLLEGVWPWKGRKYPHLFKSGKKFKKKWKKKHQKMLYQMSEMMYNRTECMWYDRRYVCVLYEIAPKQGLRYYNL